MNRWPPAQVPPAEMPPDQVERLRCAVLIGNRLYPKEVAELIKEKLRDWEAFGYRIAATGPAMKLVECLEAEWAAAVAATAAAPVPATPANRPQTPGDASNPAREGGDTRQAGYGSLRDAWAALRGGRP